MKLKDLFSITKNKRNNQYNFNLRIKKLRQMGMTPQELNEMILLKPKTKFYKK